MLLRRVTVMYFLLLAGCGTTTEGLFAPDDPATAPIPPAAEARFAEGVAAMESERWTQALTMMESLWHDYPWLSGPALDAALICEQLQQTDTAEIWYLRAIESNAENITARNAYAVLLRKQGRFTDARNQYQAALDTAEDNAETHFNIGILYDLYLGDKTSALQHYQRYQSLTDDSDRQVAGWIIDLRRQLETLATTSGDM